jgi:hypothetical protein
MSKPCRRPARAAIKKLRSEKKQQEKALNAKLRAMGQVPQSPAAQQMLDLRDRRRGKPVRTP